MNKMPSQIFWDFDGTLFNTYPQIADSFMTMLKDLQIVDLFSKQEILCYLKVNFAHAFRCCAEKACVDSKMLADTFRCYHKQILHFPPYDGLEECLRTLISLGCNHYLYTHRNRSAIINLQQEGLWQYFTDGIISEMKFPSKPDPAALQWLCDSHHINASCCVMVGDRDIDLEAGKAAGMQRILFDPDNYYADYQSEWRVSCMQDIIRLYS